MRATGTAIGKNATILTSRQSHDYLLVTCQTSRLVLPLPNIQAYLSAASKHDNALCV